ncbi:MAG: RcnB family protein [Pseudomonadota bacterium]|nr:RcnB family protein [Pseudomonadota bacterium]
MRKFLVPLMAASMLVPAAAYADDGGLVRGMRNHAERASKGDSKLDDGPTRSQRSERSNGDRPARAERAPRGERASGVDRVQRIERVDGEDRGVRRIERADRDDHGVRRIERVRPGDRDVRQIEQVQVIEPVQPIQQTERRREGLAGAFSQIGRDGADGRRGDRDDDRDWRRDRDGRRDNDRDWRRDRDGRHGWSRDWRRDHRYDWSNYRNRYRTLYRLGRYYDPYGYGYRRFSIGLNLWPSYYRTNYWLDDPWRYRLPPAYGPYRWVRYYDDALLVNIYSGQVVDVIHNFFW